MVTHVLADLPSRSMKDYEDLIRTDRIGIEDAISSFSGPFTTFSHS